MVNILTPLAIILFNINLTSMMSNGRERRTVSPENDVQHLLCDMKETWSNQGILLNNGSLNLNFLNIKYFYDSIAIEKLKDCLHISISNLIVTSCEDIIEVNSCLVLAEGPTTRTFHKIKTTGSKIVAAIKDKAVVIKNKISAFIHHLFDRNYISSTIQEPTSNPSLSTSICCPSEVLQLP